MSTKRLLTIFVVCIVIGVAWGLSSVLLLGHHYVASQDPADYCEYLKHRLGLIIPPGDCIHYFFNCVYDVKPPGDCSAFGKSVFFPGWASAQLTTIDGYIYHAGPNTDMYNPFLYIYSIGIAVILCAALVPSVTYLRVRKVRTTC